MDIRRPRNSYAAVVGLAVVQLSRTDSAQIVLARPEDALAEYAQALELRPNDGYIYVNRGWLHEKQGRPDLARADYEKAASLTTPDDWLKRALERTR
jgi:tetratricopeptide (TPR) repeat protein